MKMRKQKSRDMMGYGSQKIKIVWPNKARLALQIVLNYEEGAENCVLHGDKFSETCLLYTSPSPRDATLSRMPSSG